MVLELAEKKGKKYAVYLNGELYCRCYPKDLRAFGFDEPLEGQKTETENAVLVELERTVFLQRARRRALLLLGKKEYTKREMEKKLVTDGYPAGVVDATLEYLSELHYVEDQSYAGRYALYLLPRHSEREIYQKMLQKGFEKELIKEAIEAAKKSYRLEHGSIGEEVCSPESDAIRTFLRKKGYQAECTDAGKKKKIVMSLYRKGFLLSDIRTVIGEWDEVPEALE